MWGLETTSPWSFFISWTRGSSVSVVTGLRAGRTGFDSRRGHLYSPSSLLPNGQRGLLPQGYSIRGVKFTTHFLLVPRLRMRGAITPLPHTSSWCGTWLNTESFLIYHYTNMAAVRNLRWDRHYQHLLQDFEMMCDARSLINMMLKVKVKVKVKLSLCCF